MAADTAEADERAEEDFMPVLCRCPSSSSASSTGVHTLSELRATDPMHGGWPSSLTREEDCVEFPGGMGGITIIAKDVIIW